MQWRVATASGFLACAGVLALACVTPRSTVVSGSCTPVVGRPAATLYRARVPDSSLVRAAATSVVVRVITARDDHGEIARVPLEGSILRYASLEDSVVRWQSLRRPQVDRSVFQIDSIRPGVQYLIGAMRIGFVPHVGWIVPRSGYADTLELEIVINAVCRLDNRRS
jgi:hypothetical protein